MVKMVIWATWTMIKKVVLRYVSVFKLISIYFLFQDSDEEDSLNFDQDPAFAHLPQLDKMRKVRREVLKTINDFRQHAGLGIIHTDQFTNNAANEYARYLLENENDKEALTQLINYHHIVEGPEPMKELIGFAYLDDDQTSTDNTKQAEFLDAHGLLLEMQSDLKELMNKQYTHVGIGFAANTKMVKIVELLSARLVMVSHLNQLETGEVQVEG